MPANPTIKSVSATKSTTDTFIMALLENTSRGTVQMRAYLDALCVTEDVAMRSNWCVESSVNIYISELYKLVNCIKTTGTTATRACLRAYKCNVGENCDTLACTTWNSSFNSTATEIAINGVLGNMPIAVSGLTITPGDKSLSVSWGDVDQTTIIWAYDILLRQGDTTLVSGSREKNTMTIANLINGTEYTVTVYAWSYDGYVGPGVTKTATPVAACIPPLCNLKME